jgi:hypothetical protein
MKNKELEEAVVNSWLDYEHVEGHLYSTTYRAGFEAGAKWQAERMYSEGEVISLLRKYRFDLTSQKTAIIGDTAPLWFEQFKKTKDGK